MLLILFSLALVGTNVICFAKKKYLYLFIPCMLFLPTYYGIDISDGLPIISVTRIMFLVFYIYCFINRKNDINIKNIKLSSIPIEYKILCGYFILRIISNCYYASNDSDALKTIFGIFFEHLLFLIAVYILSPSKDEINQTLRIVVYVAAILFAVGIYESITLTKPLNFLYTVSRSMLNDFYIRLGLLRATTTMGLPGIYGNMCILIYPIILYLYETTKEKKFIFLVILNIFANIHSGSRSDLFFFLGITFIYAILVIMDKKKNNLEFLKTSIIVIISCLIIIMILRNVNVYLKYYYDSSALSFLNQIGFHFDLNKNAPSGVKGFGMNETTGTASRVVQFTGIQRALEINPLFGQGAGALLRSEVRYNWKGKWLIWKAFDMGIVEITISEGLVGLAGMICLFVCWIIRLMKNIKVFMENLSGKIIFLLLPTYLIITLSTANMFSFLMFYLFITHFYLENMISKKDSHY